MDHSTTYQAKTFHLRGLRGISDKTLDMHLTLYEGYVKETNRLTAKITEMLQDGRVDQEEMPAYSELKRRLGFEYNGVILHEYYFGNLKKGGGGDPATASQFARAAETSFGSVQRWKTDLVSVGTMRGVGWAICYLDPRRDQLANHWVTLHEIGNVAGLIPLVVMDVWEHAFLLDYQPAERSKYIEAFFANLDWEAVEERLLVARRSTATGGAKKAA